jgi:hypothetical protein
MFNRGKINGQRLFPANVVDTISTGGDQSKFGGFATIEKGSYTSQWWAFHNDHGAYAARGVHGQTIYVDPTAEMVLARFPDPHIVVIANCSWRHRPFITLVTACQARPSSLSLRRPDVPPLPAQARSTP